MRTVTNIDHEELTFSQLKEPRRRARAHQYETRTGRCGHVTCRTVSDHQSPEPRFAQNTTTLHTVNEYHPQRAPSSTRTQDGNLVARKISCFERALERLERRDGFAKENSREPGWQRRALFLIGRRREPAPSCFASKAVMAAPSRASYVVCSGGRSRRDLYCSPLGDVAAAIVEQPLNEKKEKKVAV